MPPCVTGLYAEAVAARWGRSRRGGGSGGATEAVTPRQRRRGGGAVVAVAAAAAQRSELESTGRVQHDVVL